MIGSDELRWRGQDGYYIPTSERPPLPQKTRRAVCNRANGHCEDCGQYYPGGEIHHNHYGGLYSDEDISDPSDLAYLCRDCHKKRHLDPFGYFWCDPIEMQTEMHFYIEEFSKD